MCIGNVKNTPSYVYCCKYTPRFNLRVCIFKHFLGDGMPLDLTSNSMLCMHAGCAKHCLLICLTSAV